MLTKEKELVEENVEEEEDAVVPETLESQKATESVQVPDKQPVTAETPVLETETPVLETVPEPETEPELPSEKAPEAQIDEQKPEQKPEAQSEQKPDVQPEQKLEVEEESTTVVEEPPKKEDAVVPSSPTPVASSSTTSSSSSSGKQEERSYPATSSSSSAEPSTKSYWQHPQNEPMPQYSMGWPSLISIPEFQYNKPLPPPQQPVSLYSVEAGDAVVTPPDALAKTRSNKRNSRRGGGKKRLNRLEMIEDQRQSYTPPMKSRCDFWPTCSNRNCKFRHPVKPCRYVHNPLFRCDLFHNSFALFFIALARNAALVIDVCFCILQITTSKKKKSKIYSLSFSLFVVTCSFNNKHPHQKVLV